jgi:hypothetical protein
MLVSDTGWCYPIDFSYFRCAYWCPAHMVSKGRITTPPDCTYSVQPKRYQCGIADILPCILPYVVHCLYYCWKYLVVNYAGRWCWCSLLPGCRWRGVWLREARWGGVRPACSAAATWANFLLAFSIGCYGALASKLRASMSEKPCMIGFSEGDTCRASKLRAWVWLVCGCLGRTGTASKLIAGTYDVL